MEESLLLMYMWRIGGEYKGEPSQISHKNLVKYTKLHTNFLKQKPQFLNTQKQKRSKPEHLDTLSIL